MSASSTARRTTSRVPWSELGLGTAAITTSAYLYDTYSNDMIMRRLLRAGIAVGQIGYWYKFESPETAEASSARHRKAARKMAEVCGKNEGLFVKFGQALSTLNHILPPEYTEELAILLTDAPPVAFCHIRETIEEEINTPSFRQQYVTAIATSVGVSSLAALSKTRSSHVESATSSPRSTDQQRQEVDEAAVKKETWKEQYRRKQEEPSTLSNVASFMTSSPVEVAKSTALPTLIASSHSDDQTTKSSSSSGATTPQQNQAAQDAAALLTFLNLNNGDRSSSSGHLSSPKESSKEASEKSVEGALNKIKTGQRLTVEDVFEWIEEEPIATASIAQVHRAVINVPIPANRSPVLNLSSKTDEHGIHNAVATDARISKSAEAQENEDNGAWSPSPMRQLYRPVAVKVLKPQIKWQMHWDLWIHEKMLSFTESQFGLPLEWAKETIRHNTLRECDFGSEAQVLRRVEAMLLQRHCALENSVKYCRKTLASPNTSTTPATDAIPGDGVSGSRTRAGNLAQEGGGQGGGHCMSDRSHQPTEGRSRRVPVTTPVPKTMPDVTVPSVVDHLSSDRMLVTDWVDGLKMTDTKKVTDAGFHPGNFLTAMYEAYADLVFHDGIVHADPHAGNVFVRWVPKTPLAAEYASSPFQLFASLEAAKSFFKDSAFGADQEGVTKTSATSKKRKDMKQQIVLLDWGLYDEASPDFRRKYAQLFECALTHDMEGVKAVMSSWNCGNTDIMASLLIQKPMAGDIKAMKKRLSKEEIKEMHTRVHSNIVSIFESASKVPRELIHITRGMNHLRSLNKPFGLPVNRVQVFADRAVLALDDAASWSWSQLAWWYVIRAAAWLGFVMGKRHGQSSEEEGAASLVQGETQ